MRNPRTGKIDYTLEPPSAGELAEVARRLRSNQPAWESGGVRGRTEALLKWRDAIESHRERIVEALVTDTGRKTESELEVNAITRSIERWCELGPRLLAQEDPRASSVPGIFISQGFQAYELVAAISPWNFPLLLSLIDGIPALVAGCSVVIKPSEVAPRFIEPISETITKVPELRSVLAYVDGAGETGADLIDLVDAVCFTGSVPTGRKVAAQAAARFIPAFLELGGKDPAIVLASADLERATSGVLWGSTSNAGQACQSIERVYVDSSIFEDFVALLSQKARSLKLAIPEPSSGQIGPIIDIHQTQVITDHLDDAYKKGAEAVVGGEAVTHEGGFYCPATVLTGVDHSMKVMTEETFGPIIPVMSFDSVDDAVQLANDTTYGLSAAVFAGEAEEAMQVAQRIKAGAVSINDAALTAMVHDAEKNSFNFSGLGGSRMGPAALRRFGRRQGFLINESTEPDPWWHRLG